MTPADRMANKRSSLFEWLKNGRSRCFPVRDKCFSVKE